MQSPRTESRSTLLALHEGVYGMLVVHRETVYDGLASAPTAMNDMLAGRTVGKTLVRL